MAGHRASTCPEALGFPLPYSFLLREVDNKRRPDAMQYFHLKNIFTSLLQGNGRYKRACTVPTE